MRKQNLETIVYSTEESLHKNTVRFQLRDISSHYLSLTSTSQVLLHDSRSPGLTELRPVGEEINFWIKYILFWPCKDMEGLPGWGIISIPEPPPRQHKHERRYTPGTHSVIPIRRIWNDDYGGQMIFGFLTFVWQVRKNPEKTLTDETCPDRGSNPDPLRDRQACYRLFQSSELRDIFNSLLLRNG